MGDREDKNKNEEKLEEKEEKKKMVEIRDAGEGIMVERGEKRDERNKEELKRIKRGMRSR